jgi:hypothetical protein
VYFWFGSLYLFHMLPALCHCSCWMLRYLFTFRVDRSILVFRYDCVLLYCYRWSPAKGSISSREFEFPPPLYLVCVREFRGMENWTDGRSMRVDSSLYRNDFHLRWHRTPRERVLLSDRSDQVVHPR